MAKFKVGDKVIGNASNRYTYTNRKAVSVVTKIYPDSDKMEVMYIYET